MPYDNIHTLCRRFTNLVKNMGMTVILQDLTHTFASHLAMSGLLIPVLNSIGLFRYKDNYDLRTLFTRTHDKATKKLRS